MGSRLLLPTFRANLFSRYPVAANSLRFSRAFKTTSRLLDTTIPAPVRKPVGAFRGGLFGFLLGSTASGAAVYYYILEEYKVSNELLTEDIYALQAAVQRIEGYVKSLEDRVVEMSRKK